MAGLAFFFIAKYTALPRTFDIQLELAKPETLKQLSLQWYEGPELLKAVTFNFETPPEPTTVRSTLFVPTGRYRVRINAKRSQGETDEERVIDLQDPTHPVIIPVR